MVPVRDLAAVQAVLACGVIARLHSFTTPPESTTGQAHTGLLISIVIVAFYAVWAAVQGFGGGPLRPRLFAEVGVAVYAGVTVMIAVDQMHAPGDRQAANMLIFGGIALLNLTVWLQLRREARQ